MGTHGQKHKLALMGSFTATYFFFIYLNIEKYLNDDLLLFIFFFHRAYNNKGHNVLYIL